MFTHIGRSQWCTPSWKTSIWEEMEFRKFWDFNPVSRSHFADVNEVPKGDAELIKGRLLWEGLTLKRETRPSRKEEKDLRQHTLLLALRKPSAMLWTTHGEWKACRASHRCSITPKELNPVKDLQKLRPRREYSCSDISDSTVSPWAEDPAKPYLDFLTQEIVGKSMCVDFSY